MLFVNLCIFPLEVVFCLKISYWPQLLYLFIAESTEQVIIYFTEATVFFMALFKSSCVSFGNLLNTQLAKS